jgi:hypothetical protein
MEPIVNPEKQVTSSIKTQKPRATKKINFNPFLPEFYSNPYPIYHRLRSEDPIHKSIMGPWILTRYADIKAVLHDPRFRADKLLKRVKEKNQHIGQTEFAPLTQAIGKWLLLLDPPDHTRLRGMASKALLHWTGERMPLYIQDAVDKLIGKVRNIGFMDIIADLACPLPTIVMARILGVPDEGHSQLGLWSNDLSHVFEPLMSLEDYERLNQVAVEFTEYFRGLIAERENTPKEDLLSALILVREQGDRLSEDELLSICIMLFTGGGRPTLNLIGNGILALVRHPVQMELLKQEPGIIQSTVEELLRYDTPAQLIARVAIEDVKICDQTIQAGEQVHLFLGAANRDPAQFRDPDRLDITRGENRHLAFGGGIHYCLAAVLARSQGQIAINTLVQQLPNLKLHTNTLEWQKNIAIRGLKSLPVSFTP